MLELAATLGIVGAFFGVVAFFISLYVLVLVKSERMQVRPTSTMELGESRRSAMALSGIAPIADFIPADQTETMDMEMDIFDPDRIGSAEEV